MNQTQALTFGALVVFLGFALVKIGSGLVRMYERAIRAEPKKVMSWDVLSTIAAGPWSIPLSIGVTLIGVGIVAAIVGGLMFILASFPFFAG